MQSVVHNIDSTLGTLGFKYAETLIFCMLLAIIHLLQNPHLAAKVSCENLNQMELFTP
jgi:hypothetical protein